MNSIETLVEARQFVFETVAVLEGSWRDLSVHQWVPTPGNARSPVVIVDLNDCAIAPDQFGVPVRCYVSANDGDVVVQQQLCERLVDEVEAQLGAESLDLTGRIAFIDNEGGGVWVADLTVEVPRTL